MSSDPSFNPVTGYSVAYTNSSEQSQFAVNTENIGESVNLLSLDGSASLIQSSNAYKLPLKHCVNAPNALEL